MRALLFVVFSCVLGALVVPSFAQASAGQESLMMDDNQLMYRGDQTGDTSLSVMAALGVDRVRITAHWRAIAPAKRPKDETNPASYAPTGFDNLDHVLRVARQDGIKVLLDVQGPAPAWASGKTIKGDSRKADGDVKPSALHFQKFVQMMGRRYDGTYADENQGSGALPRVDTWSVWNEPNQGQLLAPQWQRDKKKQWQMASPGIYRGLVRAFSAGLAASKHGSDTLILGETAPLGNKNPGIRSHIKPVPFMQELFCLGPNNKPLSKATAKAHGCDFATKGKLKVAAYAHHAYSVTSPPETASTDPKVATLADRKRIYDVLDAAAKAGRINKNLPVWITEYGYQTDPPDPYRGVSLDQQADYLSRAEAIERSDPRIAVGGQFLLRDDDPIASFPASDRRYWGTYQSGLYFADGSPKPALDAYRIPLTGAGNQLWGMIRPLGGPLGGTLAKNAVVQYRADANGAWGDVGSVSITDPRGAFSFAPPNAQPGQYRVEWPPPDATTQSALPLGLLSPPPSTKQVYTSAPVTLGK